MLFRDDSWLSLTPEPERLLPEARAVLRGGHAPPPPAVVAAERAAAERLVLGARRTRWEAWLRDSAILAAATERRAVGAAAREQAAATCEQNAAPGEQTAAAREQTAATIALVRDVVANHDALALGLPGARRGRGR